MTTAEIKEMISTSIVRLLANTQGFKVSIPEQDHGVDMVINKIRIYQSHRGIHYTDSDKNLHLQLKCTTEKGVIRTNDTIKFDLKVKNYDDLVIRRTIDNTIPFILVLVVLPISNKKWVGMESNNLLIKNETYWFYPPKNVNLSKNKQTVRISIPSKNKATINFFNDLFDYFYKKKL